MVAAKIPLAAEGYFFELDVVWSKRESAANLRFTMRSKSKTAVLCTTSTIFG
jgi:hypothetical protein